MIQIVGNSAKKVELGDLKDVVFFKQQKSFSDSDYAKSTDLKREIASGRLIVLKRTDDVRPTNDGNGFRLEGVESLASSPSEQPMLDSLIAKVNTLEEAMVSPTPQVDPNLLDSLVSILEGKLESQMGSLRDTLEAKLFKSDSEVFNRKIDELMELVKAGATIAPKHRIDSYSTPKDTTQNPSDSFVDEVYVPTIRVVDGNDNIILKTRVIEGGSNVSSALDALKSLKR